MCLQYKYFENIVGKGEIARDEQFLLFPQCFLPILRTFCHFLKFGNCRLTILSVEKFFVLWETFKVPVLLNCHMQGFNPLPNDSVLALSKLKAFVEDRLSITRNIKLICCWVENIDGKGWRKCWLLVFALFLHNVFKKTFFL